MTDKEAKAFYNSKAWKDPDKGMRITILRRDNWECQDCRKRIREANEKGIKLSPEDRKIRRACEVHHIRELKEFPELALVPDNLVSLCTQCHNIRHGRNPKKFVRKKKLVSEEKW